MKRRNLIYLIIIITFNSLILVQNANAVDYPLNSFETDKIFYYTNETIRMNASWQDIEEYGYIQFSIFDNYDNPIWFSSKYYYADEANWFINIQELNLTILKSTTLFNAKCIFYYKSPILSYKSILGTKEFEILKRDISCDLIGFNNKISQGNNLSFKGQFSDNTINSSVLITNQTIYFEIFSRSDKKYNETYSTDQFGIIEIFISSDYLDLGVNYLYFTLKENKFYYDFVIEFVLLVEEVNSSQEKREQETMNGPFQLNIFILFLGIFSLLGTISMIFYSKRKHKLIELQKITFKF